MPIELQSFRMSEKLEPLDMANLVETVCAAAMLNKKLCTDKKTRLSVGCILMNYANAMLESCGSEVDITVSNPEWKTTAKYHTGENNV